jgi:hypothetical protein
VNARTLPLLILLLAVSGCRSAESDRADFEVSTNAGEDVAAEGKLRKALDRHPEDVKLLIAAAEFYLRPHGDEFHRPRLALHYALRADKAANYASADVGRTLMRAYRAAGGVQGTEVGRRLVAEGLQAVNHPDRAAPKRLPAVDRDLLDPTLSNVLEQERRNRRRAEGHTPCSEGFVHVPEGTYPGIRGGPEVTVAEFCVERPAGTGIGQLSADESRRAAACDARGARLCTGDETAVACGALRTVVGRHTACEDERVVRCCSDPEPL